LRRQILNYDFLGLGDESIIEYEDRGFSRKEIQVNLTQGNVYSNLLYGLNDNKLKKNYSLTYIVDEINSF